MNDWGEKACQLCLGISGLYYRRNTLVVKGEVEKARDIEPHINSLLEDLKFWLLKEEN